MTNQNDIDDQNDTDKQLSEKLDINEQLEEAFAAKAELAAGDALREKAERIPELLREKAQQVARERAEAVLEANIGRAIPQFGELAQRVRALRERLQDLIDAVPLLASDMRRAQEEFLATGGPLLAACEAYDRAYAGEKPRMGLGEIDNSLPPEMQVGGTRFDEALARAGATNPDLDLMPAEGLPEWMSLLLRKHQGSIIFRPGQGSRNWRRHF